jgi:hypothetical protein
MSFKTNHSTMFKATCKVTSTRSDALQAGQPVPFSLLYKKAETGETVYEVKEVTDPNMPVYYRKLLKMTSVGVSWRVAFIPLPS